MQTLWTDIRYGLRLLAKYPGFTTVAVLTIALGVGANTAIFSLLDAVMLQNLPVRQPEQLVLFSDSPEQGVITGDQTGRWGYFSSPLYEYFRRNNKFFVDICAFQSSQTRIAVRAEGPALGQTPETVWAKLVSPNYFSVLGVRAVVGRTFEAEDDRDNASMVAVISYNYWNRRFNLSPSVQGQGLEINGLQFSIIGVAPSEFLGERVGSIAPEIWLPIHIQPGLMEKQSWLDNPTVNWLDLMGRLKRGATIRQAQTAVDLELRQFLTEGGGTGLAEHRKQEIAESFVKLAPGGRGLSTPRFRYSEPLRVLMAVAGLVLLIACANVANLLLAHALGRAKEVSVRLALGAARTRIVRQLLTESALLGGLGGVIGLLFALWGVPLLVSLVSNGVETHLPTSLNLRVFSFTVVISLLTVILFGLTPAMQATRVHLVPSLKGESLFAGTGSLRKGLWKGLVVAQVAASLVLLVCAGLFMNSLMRLESQDLGFQKDHVLLVETDARIVGYKPAHLFGLYQALLERIQALPGVQSVSVGSTSPLSGWTRTADISFDRGTRKPGADTGVGIITVGPRYFETEGIPFLLGRDISTHDGSGSPMVAVVNESFARYFLSAEDPIGKRFALGSPYEGPGIEIVGIVKDAKFDSVREKPSPIAFLPVLQMQGDDRYVGEIELRASGDPTHLIDDVRAAIHEVASNLPVMRVITPTEQVEHALNGERITAKLCSFFALLALVLACVGLYGTMSYAVTRRTHEIGIRMAVGAQASDLLGMVLRDALVLLGIGLAFGIPTALAASQLISSQLYDLKPMDPITLGGAVAILSSVAALAGYIPARQATRVNPIVALRHE